MIYAIGDIHGQKAMLDHALALIEKDGGPDAQIVFLGDYTDRGPDSAGVLDTLIKGVNAGRNWVCLMGNHDKMFHDYVTAGVENSSHVKSGISWLNRRLGGITTLASYGVTGDAHFLHPAGGGIETLASYAVGTDTLTPAQVQKRTAKAVPKYHLNFLAERPVAHETDDLIFCHAGLRPGIPLKDQSPDDLLWIRDGWLEDTRDHGKLVVHGHTALDRPQHHGNRVNLDGGAGYGRPLIPAVFDGRECWLLTDQGREVLWPHHA